MVSPLIRVACLSPSIRRVAHLWLHDPVGVGRLLQRRARCQEDDVEHDLSQASP